MRPAYLLIMNNAISCPMRIVLLGPPGSGKGTQAEKICRYYKIPRISAGDLLRKEGAEQTPLGKEARAYMAKGLLVPDRIVTVIIENRLKLEDCKEGFLLDGYPRNLSQAMELERMCKVDAVLYLELGIENALERLEGRRTCTSCETVYHLRFKPPKNNGFCDKCRKKLSQRDDDKRETVIKRFETYEKETIPLVNYYSNNRLLRRIDARKNIEETFAQIRKVLGRYQK